MAFPSRNFTGTGIVSLVGGFGSQPPPEFCTNAGNGNCNTIASAYIDSGMVSVTVNGLTKSVPYNQSGTGDTGANVAAGLASAFNGDSNSPVTASVNGGTLTLTSKAGSGAALSISAKSQSQGTLAAPSIIGVPSDTFTGTASVNLVGVAPAFVSQGGDSFLLCSSDGSGGCNFNGVGYNDSGMVSVTVNGFTKSVPYNQSGTGDTGANVAAGLASAFNGDSNSPVTASVNGRTLTLTSKTGSGTTLLVSATAQGGGAALPSIIAIP